MARARLAVTPKVNGLEAFLVGHAHGVALVMRRGTVRAAPWSAAPADRVFPFVLEGEVLEGGGRAADADVFVAYDCAQSPVARYGAHGRYAARHAAAVAVCRRLAAALPAALGVAARTKPHHPLNANPYAAIGRCAAWAAERGVACDGVVLVDAGAPGYARGDRLWKRKDAPTVDFAVYAVAPAARGAPAAPPLYELMLRGDGAMMQSVHRFRSAPRGGGPAREFRAPVLLAAPPAWRSPTGRSWSSPCAWTTTPTAPARGASGSRRSTRARAARRPTASSARST